jgi:hypothetical protein
MNVFERTTVTGGTLYKILRILNAKSFTFSTKCQHEFQPHFTLYVKVLILKTQLTQPNTPAMMWVTRSVGPLQYRDCGFKFSSRHAIVFHLLLPYVLRALWWNGPQHSVSSKCIEIHSFRTDSESKDGRRIISDGDETYFYGQNCHESIRRD